MVSRVFGTPLMIARAKLEVILGVAPLAGGAVEPIDAEADPAPQTSITVERIAVVSVIGTFVSRSGYLATTSGLLHTPILATTRQWMTRRSAASSRRRLPGGEVGGLDLVERCAWTGDRKIDEGSMFAPVDSRWTSTSAA
jgi:hypothetical protein